jgi:hypothetical protein
MAMTTSAYSRAARRRIAALIAIAALIPLGALAIPTPATSVNASHAVVVSDNPVGWTPHILDANGYVKAIAQVGNTVFAGGSFTRVQEVASGQIFNRTNIVAFDAQTGAIRTAFNPSIAGKVLAIDGSPDGQSVYVGGLFNRVNGASQRKLVKLRVSDGAVLNFLARPDGNVKDLVRRGTALYLAGEFAAVSGVARQGFAALDAATGAVLTDVNIQFTQSRNPLEFPQVVKIDVSAAGDRLVAVGDFTKVGGLDRWMVAVLDLTTTPVSVADWATNRFQDCTAERFPSYIRDVDFAPDGSYFVIVTTGGQVNGSLCDAASRWETYVTGTALRESWANFTGGDTLYSVAITGTAVYVGGHQRWQNNEFCRDCIGPGGVDRPGIAGLSPANGVPFTWNPTRMRGLGAFMLLATPDGLWVGSDTDRLGGEYHAKIGMLPVAGGSPVPAAEPGSVPGTMMQITQGGALVRRTFNGTSFGAATTVATGVDWSPARGAFMLSGSLYTPWADGRLLKRSFDGVNAGPAQVVNLLGIDIDDPDPSLNLDAQIASMTGSFFRDGRWYYGVEGDGRMLVRYINPESDIIGPRRFPVSSSCNACNWGAVEGFTMAGSTIYFASANGNLSRVGFANGRISGTPQVISGPGIDGIDWSSRALFLLST